jgi:hypothetical protein
LAVRIGDEGALVLRHRSPNLDEQRVLRVIAGRSVQEHDLTTGVLEGFE